MTKLDALARSLAADVIHDFIRANDGTKNIFEGFAAAGIVAAAALREFASEVVFELGHNNADGDDAQIMRWLDGPAD